MIGHQTIGEQSRAGAFDRQRRAAVTVQPRLGKLLTTINTYANNLLSSTTDPYGRKSYNVYRSSDSALIRTIQGTVPADGVTDPGMQTRDLSPNAKYIVGDIVLDAERQVSQRIDGRGITASTTFDSRGRTIERREAFGTADEARTVTIYDANSNVICLLYTSPSPRD